MEKKVTADGNARMSWWVWIAWLNRADERHFLYGCAARTFRPADWSDKNASPIGHNPARAAVDIRQRIVSEEIFQAFRNGITNGEIKLDILLGESVAVMPIGDHRDVLQDGFGHSGIHVDAYYTLPDLQLLTGADDAILAEALSILQGQLNLPFRDAYASRLGNFEIFDLHAWLEKSEPFLIEAVPQTRGSLAGPETLEICREPDFAKDRHIAHVVGRVGGDVVVDRAIILEPCCLRVPVESPERLDQLDFRMFDGTGATLLHSTHSTYLNRIHFGLSPISQQTIIEDDLSERAGQAKGSRGAKGTIVRSYITQRSQIGAPAKGSWRRFAEEMTDWVQARLPKPSEDKWFARGIEGEVGAIAFINRLLHGGSVQRAVLADPWFGVEALQRVALRLESRDVPLTIVTSWTRTDPDTGSDLDESAPTARLEAALGKVARFLNARLTLINLADGKSQAFHDRYLVLYMHEGPAKVFMLSNSLNKAAGDWPFAMSLLAADVAREVRLYIEGLCTGRDTVRGKALATTFKWPPDAGKSTATSR